MTAARRSSEREVGSVRSGCDTFGLGGNRQTQRRFQKELRRRSHSLSALDKCSAASIILVASLGPVYQWRVDRGGGEYASLKPLQVLTFDLARSAGGMPHSFNKINKIRDLLPARLPCVYQCCAPKSSRDFPSTPPRRPLLQRSFIRPRS